MRRRGWLMVSVLVIAPAVVPSAAGARYAGPSLEPRDCGVLDAPVELECHWLVVPERRDARDANTIKLAVMVLHSRTSDPLPDPVVFLAGGPGGSGIEGFENFYTSPMLETRDVILFDQRGTGLSEPALECPERQDASDVDFSRAEPHQDELADLRAATQECRDRLIDEGIDLDGYDTRENASDVADLRAALGFDEWNLYGVSYGTRLALEVMRSHPEGIRSAVLDSVYPPDADTVDQYVSGVEDAFQRLEDACNADTSCAELQPNLLELLQTTVERFDAEPARLELVDGSTLTVTGSDVLAGLWDAMYVSDNIPPLPTVIESLSTGDIGILQVLAEQATSGFAEDSEGMFLSVECADNGVSARDQRLIDDPGRAEVVVRYSAQPYCDLWDVTPLPRSFHRPVRSKIPTLVVAGSLDPITPASDSARAAKTLKRSVFVEFENLGHVVTRGTDCPRQIRQDFLNDPIAAVSGELDTACADEPPPGFLSQGLI